MPIEPGAQARATHVVADEDTAVSMETGEVSVLASSRLIAWCERATLSALLPHVDPGQTSVAMRMQLDHVRPAAVGAVITIIATLERIEGRRYVFVVSAIDACREQVATGRIVRVVVDTASFVASACEQGS